MKKLLFLFILILFSCEKSESTYCWECKTVTTYESTHSIPQTETEINSLCDMTEQEITAWEKERTSTITIKIGTLTATTTKVCKCNKN